MTREAFTDLVLDSEPTLYRVAMSMLRNEKDCEDAVQTAILTAYEKLGTLKHEEYFKTWLVRILINVCNKQLKSASKTTELNNSDLSSGNKVNHKNSRRHCQKPPEQRQNLVKGLFEGLTAPPCCFHSRGCNDIRSVAHKPRQTPNTARTFLTGTFSSFRNKSHTGRHTAKHVVIPRCTNLWRYLQALSFLLFFGRC